MNLVKKPKTARGAETLQRICDAAEELFAESGYYNTQISDIAKKAGIASGTFYIYFPDKISAFRSLLTEVRAFVESSLVPDAQTLDRIAYRTTIFAFPIFGFGVIFGANEVLAVAVADEAGHKGASSGILAAFALGSAISGRGPQRDSTQRRKGKASTPAISKMPRAMAMVSVSISAICKLRHHCSAEECSDL